MNWAFATDSWRWKLWHSVALGAASSLVLAVELGILEALAIVVTFGILIAPPWWAAGLWDRFVWRSPDKSLPPPPRYGSLLTRAAWFLLIVVPWGQVVFFILMALFYSLSG